MSWQSDAACRGMDSDLFHPRRLEIAKQAKAVCSECSVRALCLREAMDRSEGEDIGIWGGTTANERREVRRRERRLLRGLAS